VKHFKHVFAEKLNFDKDGRFLYPENIFGIPSRPIGTPYNETSFAFIHKNVLFVTIDVLHQTSAVTRLGEDGTVTGQVVGDHLDWFDSILQAGQNSTQVQHMIVQGHFPVLYPVRKVKSSGIYMKKDGSNSPFWNTMRERGVDIYFAGEVRELTVLWIRIICHLHWPFLLVLLPVDANTVSKDPQSNLFQITSTAKYFSNFLTVDVSDDSIDVYSYSEYGKKELGFNNKYRSAGRFVLRKDENRTTFQSEGDLFVLNSTNAVLHFNFEEVSLLKNRPVHGLFDYENKSKNRYPVIEKVVIRGIECRHSLMNNGEFGQSYDAQVANVQLNKGLHGKAGTFTANSRAAIYAMGPHHASNIISYSIWFKTKENSNVMLIAYEGYWTKPKVMNLRLHNGILEVCHTPEQKLVVQDDNAKALNDGKWHHAAVVMPYKNCQLSRLEMYVDGKQMSTALRGPDSKARFPSGGSVSIGGFGYSAREERLGFLKGQPFIGEIDEVFVWARRLSKDEIIDLAKVW
jgi:hypothetical protein